MESRNWGNQGFNFTQPSMGFSGNMQNDNMAFSRMDQGFGMRPSNFQTYNRNVSYQDMESDNHDMRVNAHWAPFEPSQPKWRNKERKRANSALKLKQLYKREEKSQKSKGNPQQSNSPSGSWPTSSGVTQQKQTRTPNGDMKKRNPVGGARDTDASSPLQKKLKTKETPANSNVVNSSGGRGETNIMFSCNLCQYHTPDEKEIQNHFYSTLHREVLKHLYIFFPRQRVDFLHEYLIFKKKKMSFQQKLRNLHPVKDALKGIAQDHYLYRVQAIQCRACDVLIPDVAELFTAHIKSDAHEQNRKLLLKKAKDNSRAAAKELLMNAEVLEMFTKYSKKQNPFKDIACSSQVSSTNEILVAEEDDDNDDDHDDDIFDDANDEDPIADDKDDQEVPVNHNEGPANENKESRSKMCPKNEPEIIKPEAPSKTVSSSSTVPSVFAEEEEEEEEEAAEAP